MHQIDLSIPTVFIPAVLAAVSKINSLFNEVPLPEDHPELPPLPEGKTHWVPMKGSEFCIYIRDCYYLSQGAWKTTTVLSGFSLLHIIAFPFSEEQVTDDLDDIPF